MLNFEEFQESVQMNLKDYLGEELKDVSIRLNEVTKNNGVVLHAISVCQSDNNVAPNIYLDDYFKKYEEGASMEEIMNQIAVTVGKHIETPEEFKDIGKAFQDFNFVKDKLIVTTVNGFRNSAMLEGMPHQSREDLALIYKVMIGNDEFGTATITIKNEHMQMWGVSAEELHELAMKSSEALLPATVQSMNEVMREMFAKDGMPDEIAESMFAEMSPTEQMYVISNASKTNGASAMFYEGVLPKLAEDIGTDLYILPSSLHEVIAVSCEMGTPENLAEMVKEVNGTQVSVEEQLSDHVYRFDAAKNTLTLADTTMEELQSVVAESKETYEATKSTTEGARPHHHR